MSKGNRQRRRELGLLLPREFCQARSKRTGDPCTNAPIAGSVVCRMHGGAAPQVLRKAQERIVMAQDDAASNLVKWMSDESVPLTERRKCAEALLNRGGNAPGQRLEVSVDTAPWQALIEGIVSEVPDGGIRTLGSMDRKVVEGQVVDLPPALPNEPGEEDDDATQLLDPAPPSREPLPSLRPPTPPEPPRIPSRRRRGNRLAGH